MALSETVREQLRAQYKKTFSLTDPDTSTVFVFRKPFRTEWNSFQRSVVDDRVQSTDTLAKACLVWPEAKPGEPAVDQLDDFLDENPAALQVVIFPELSKLAGGALNVGNI